MGRAIAIALRIVLVLILADAGIAVAASAQRLSYVVSYQGLFSAGLPLEIAEAYLEFGPAGDASQQVALGVSTRGYRAAELLYPVRYCYRSRLDIQEGITRQADWWGRTGAKASRGRLSFDLVRRRVLRLEAKRTLEGREPIDANPRELTGISAQQPATSRQERGEAPFPSGVVPMDRLAMFWWLRQQPLEPGAVLLPAVSDGDRLYGYRILVEGIEGIPWKGGMRPSYRLRLEPRVNDGSEAQVSRLWMSRDPERLPLLLRGSRAVGSFELRLLPDQPRDMPRCEIPETSGLVLPAP